MAIEEMINLDDPGVYRQFDSQGMLNHLHNFPVLCQQAWEKAINFTLPDEYKNVNKAIILGMGGSAIGGDLAGNLIADEVEIPLVVCREYNLPRYADGNTLVIASSYSGMTEETLCAFLQAGDTPAKKLAITTGGDLKKFCQTKNIPVFCFEYGCQPRAALPFSFLAILGVLQQLGIIRDKTSEVKETLTILKQLASRVAENIPTSQNPAKLLAQKLEGRLPIIYGGGITAEVAHRWKTQINENSKSMAFYEVFSELNHNAIVGYQFPEEVAHNSMVILLFSDLLHPRLQLRYSITCRLLDQAGIYYQTVSGEGSSALSQMMSLILLGDYVSYYLAILNRVDPTPVQPIEYLKQQLART